MKTLAALLILACSTQAQIRPLFGDTLFVDERHLTAGIYASTGGSHAFGGFSTHTVTSGTIEFSFPLQDVSGVIRVPVTIGGGNLQVASASVLYSREITRAGGTDIFLNAGLFYARELLDSTDAMKHVGVPITASIFVPIGEVQGLGIEVGILPNVELFNMPSGIKFGDWNISGLFMLRYSVPL